MKKLLLGIFICLCSVFLMSYNVSALEIGQDVQFINGWTHPYWSDSNNRNFATGGYNYSTNGDHVNANYIRLRSSSNNTLSWTDGDWFSLSGSVYITTTSNSQAVSIQANPRQYFAVSGSNQSVNCPVIQLNEESFQQTQTGNDTWVLRYGFSSICKVRSSQSNANLSFDITLNGGSFSGTDYLRFIPTYLGQWHARAGYDDTAVINAINSLSSTLDELGDKLDDVTGAIQDQNDKEQEATDNISDQTPEDISSDGNTENTQTTSIINVFGGFLSALSGVNTGSCIVNLPFPSYAGGTWQMNICQNKDKAGNIVSLFGSATMIFFFLPVAWRLLGMIYNEIRSFTNG